MRIELSVKEYLNQLELMKNQYGREEDIYPWLYMILRGAVDDNISIRDVHNLKKPRPYREKDGKNNGLVRDREIYMRLGVGAPDFVLYNSSEKMIGCVEIKMMDSIQIEKSVNECNIAFEPYVRKHKIYSRGEQINVGEWQYKIKNDLPVFSCLDKVDQLFGHLEKFKYVLYTDGKVFLAFILDEKDLNGEVGARMKVEYACPTTYNSDYVYTYCTLPENNTVTAKMIKLLDLNFEFNDDNNQDKDIVEMFSEKLNLLMWVNASFNGTE